MVSLLQPPPHLSCSSRAASSSGIASFFVGCPVDLFLRFQHLVLQTSVAFRRKWFVTLTLRASTGSEGHKMAVRRGALLASTAASVALQARRPQVTTSTSWTPVLVGHLLLIIERPVDVILPHPSLSSSQPLPPRFSSATRVSGATLHVLVGSKCSPGR